MSQASGLATAIGEFGSTAVKPKTSAEYAQQLGISNLKDQTAALRFLVDLEKRTIVGYETGMPKLGNTDLRGVFAQIVTCEAQHIAVLVGLLTSNNPAKQAPQAFVTGSGVAATH